MEAHSHWRCHVLWATHSTHASHVVLVVIHFKYLLLLCSQVLVNLSIAVRSILSSVHHSESHRTWDENVVLSILTSIWCLDLRLIHEVIGMLNMVRWLALSTLQSLKLLMVGWSSVFVGVISHISSIWNNVLIWSKCALLVVTVQLLDVEAASSLMGAKSLPCLKGLILGPCAALGVQVLSQVVIWRLDLTYYICITASILESHSTTMCLI